MGYKKIPVNEVKLGMFIRLHQGWLKHPFLRSEFKLISPTDLETLKGLAIKEIEYDPGRSDLEGMLSQKKLAGTPTSRFDLPTCQETAPDGEEIPMAQRQLLDQRRKELLKNERDYKEAFARTKKIMKLMEVNRDTGVESAHQLISNIVEAIFHDEETIIHLIALYEKDILAHFHSLNVCILSLIVGKRLDLSAMELNELGMSALFHDIGKQKMPKKLFFKREGLTRAEKKYLELHPKYGVCMLTGNPNISPKMLDGVYQHHERCNGKGYPHELTEIEISKFAKIIAIVDTYDNISNLNIQGHTFTPHEALSYMYTQLRPIFCQKTLSIFIKSLGVYPPGTLVQLSDGSYGMVVLTNWEKSLRPALILYGKNIRPEEPIIINLSELEDLRISRSLRPSDTPDEVTTFFQLGKNFGFFPASVGLLSKDSSATH